MSFKTVHWYCWWAWNWLEMDQLTLEVKKHYSVISAAFCSTWSFSHCTCCPIMQWLRIMHRKNWQNAEIDHKLNPQFCFLLDIFDELKVSTTCQKDISKQQRLGQLLNHRNIYRTFSCWVYDTQEEWLMRRDFWRNPNILLNSLTVIYSFLVITFFCDLSDRQKLWKRK